MVFLTALRAVTVLLLIALPGYILMKRKMLSEACIPGFSKILLFVAQPCLAIYTFRSAEYSLEKLIDVGKFALLSAIILGAMIGGAYILLRHRYERSIYRVMTFAVGSANCAFFGIPIIEALIPHMAADVIIYTMVFSFVMNLIGWTAGSAIMARDVRYISVKKIFINPAMIGTVIALVLFVTELPLPSDLMSMVTTAGKMSTPISMIVMGMRLATMDLKKMFTNVRIYAAVFAKLVVMPLLSLLLVVFLPISPDVKVTFFIISACPIASVALNYAEIVGEGQDEAAGMLLTATMLSIVTLPLMSLFLPLLS